MLPVYVLTMNSQYTDKGSLIRLCWLAILLLVPGALQAAGWKMAPGDSRLWFEVRAENTPVQGEFRGFSVDLVFDPTGSEPANLNVRVDLTAADMNDADINAAIAGGDWFAVEEFPEAIYTSKTITQLENGSYRARGTLKVKGITQTVIFPFTLAESGARVTMEGEFILFRTDFNVGTGEWAGNDPISTDVRLWFDVSLIEYE